MTDYNPYAPQPDASGNQQPAGSYQPPAQQTAYGTSAPAPQTQQQPAYGGAPASPYGYGQSAPSQPYGAQPYGQTPTQNMPPYGTPQPSVYGQQPQTPYGAQPYGQTPTAPYGAQPYGQPYPQPQPVQNSNNGTYALSAGILGCLCCAWFWGILAIVDGILSIVFYNRAKAAGEQDAKKTIGLVLGIIAIVMGVLFFFNGVMSAAEG